MLIPEKIKQYQGQGENPDLSFLVSKFDSKLDKEFGIQYVKQESEIKIEKEEVYQDHLSEALLTSYLDYHQIFIDLGPNKTIVDIGAGYCRGSLLATDPSYKIKCISYEIVKERVEAAVRHSKSVFIADITKDSFDLPKCDALFLYIPTGNILNTLLKKIIYSSLEGVYVYVIESHGDFVDNVNFYRDFLQKVDCHLKTSTQRHDQNIYKFKIHSLTKVREIYEKVKQSDYVNKDLLPYWILKYSQLQTVCRVESKVIGSDEPRSWQANLKNCTLIRYNGEFSLQLQNPFRILQLDTQDKIFSE